jgi:hypothetical protein
MMAAMRMRRIVAALVAAFTLSVGAVVPAQVAVAAPPTCSGGTFCLFNNASDPWHHVSSWPGTTTRNTCLDFSDTAGDVSYVVNKTTTRWFVFRDSACAGAHIEIPPLQQGQIQYYGSGWDNDPVAVMRTSYTS